MNSRMVSILLLQVHLAAAMSFYSVRIIEATKAGHWEPIVAGFLLEIICVAVYLKGLSRSRSKHVIELIKGWLGNWGARLLLAPFAIFTVCRLILLVRHQTNDISTILLPQTPPGVISMFYIALTFYAASKGIALIARVSVLIFFLFIPFVPFSLLISMRNFQFTNIFPLWDATFSFVTQPSFYAGMYAHTGFLFLGLLSVGQGTPLRKIAPVLTLLALVYLLIVYVPLLIFGQETVEILVHPTLLASDTIDLEWVVFDWLPTFFIVSSSALSVLEAAVLIWMFTHLFRKLFVPVPEKWLLPILALVVYVFSINIPNMATLNRYDSALSVLALYSIVIIPAATVLSSFWQRRRTA
ncbi:GerAB/ArcD/ProY family transporter [Paenibacillus koleovorans]|uniref:GerAB/ArcD/ProY family transporter n=1 Tax=Paenibacillus koleovorans TaxID=121608 RepID=UPI000FDB809C|nr:GerAB/ArcD/ProY family transporter [Paenibacillus koleovorans]